MMTIEATLTVVGGRDFFRIEADGLRFSGATSRSVKTKSQRALVVRHGPVDIRWKLVLPPGVARDVEAYRSLPSASNPRERRVLREERLELAHRLMAECRLAMADAARALGVTPSYLGKLCSE